MKCGCMGVVTALGRRGEIAVSAPVFRVKEQRGTYCVRSEVEPRIARLRAVQQAVRAGAFSVSLDRQRQKSQASNATAAKRRECCSANERSKAQ